MPIQEYLRNFTERDWEDPGAEGTIRVALLGLGWWTIDEARPAIEESEHCETTVLVSGSKEKAERVAEETETAERGISYEEYHAGVAEEAYDAVYVSTPNATHLEYTETAAELGKDVLCEKPMAASSEAASKMVEVCERNDVTLMIAYRMQTEPAVRRVRDLVRDGFVGEPVAIHGHMSDDLLAYNPDPDQWRFDRDLSGGVTLIDIGLYPLNTIEFVLDEEPEAVYGSTSWRTDPYEGKDEHSGFQLEFPGGITAACTVSHNAFQSSRLSIVGTEGEVSIDPLFFPWEAREVTVSRGEETATVDFEQINQMTEEFDYFATCVLTDSDPVPDGQQGAKDIEIIESIYESADAGTRIEVP